MPRLYREWCQQPTGRKGLMMPVENLPSLEKSKDAGYMSVYMFDEAAAQEIANAGSSKGFSKYEVYSDKIFIDLDTGNQHLIRTTEMLADKGLAYDVYFSGGKGYHIVIPLDRVYKGTEVPYSQLAWVRSMGIEGFDPSIYKASALISMPGRVHPKTGAKKHRVLRAFGKSVKLELKRPPKPEFRLAEESSPTESLRRALAQLSGLATNPPPPGERHNSIWKTCRSLQEAGLSYETALDLMQTVNRSWVDAKDSIEIERAVKGGYRA